MFIFGLCFILYHHIPMERNHYICIPVIDVDSVLKIDKRAYPQTYLEQCKYKLKKKKNCELY